MHFLDNRCGFWTTDVWLAQLDNQTFHHTYAYDLASCSSAPKICSSLPTTEKAPTIKGRGKLSRTGSEAIRPFPLCTNWRDCRAEHPLVARPTAWALFSCAKDLFVAAMDGKGPSH